jgi:hypothetical protein
VRCSVCGALVESIQLREVGQDATPYVQEQIRCGNDHTVLRLKKVPKMTG